MGGTYDPTDCYSSSPLRSHRRIEACDCSPPHTSATAAYAKGDGNPATPPPEAPTRLGPTTPARWWQQQHRQSGMHRGRSFPPLPPEMPRVAAARSSHQRLAIWPCHTLFPPPLSSPHHQVTPVLVAQSRVDKKGRRETRNRRRTD